MVRVAAKKERERLLVLHVVLVPQARREATTSSSSSGTAKDSASSQTCYPAARVCGEAVVQAARAQLVALGGVRYGMADCLQLHTAAYVAMASRRDGATAVVAPPPPSRQPQWCSDGRVLQLVLRCGGSVSQRGGAASGHLLRAAFVMLRRVNIHDASNTTAAAAAQRQQQQRPPQRLSVAYHVAVRVVRV